MKKKISIGIAGLGFGSKVHIPAFQSIKGVKVLAIVDKDINKAKEIARKNNIPLFFDNVDDLIKQKLDAVSFALPPIFNESACKKALKKGLAVLAEKPLSVSFKKAKELAELSKKSVCVTDFEFAELKVFKKLKEIIDKKTLGVVKSVNIIWLTESRGHKKSDKSWKADFLQGGVVNLFFSHILYLIEWLFGPIGGLFADISQKTGDSLHFISEQKNNIRLMAYVGRSCPGGNSHYWEIVFEKGRIILENYGDDFMADFSISLKKDGKKKLLFKEFDKKPKEGRLIPFTLLAERFIQGVKNNKKVKPNFQDGARVQELIETIYKSSKKKKWIKL